MERAKDDIPVPTRLTAEQAIIIGKLLANYKWLLTIVTPQNNMEAIFITTDKEKLNLLESLLKKREKEVSK